MCLLKLIVYTSYEVVINSVHLLRSSMRYHKLLSQHSCYESVARDTYYEVVHAITNC